jgi:hypothetical protein
MLAATLGYSTLYLVVLNSFTVARRWLRPAGRWSEMRKLVVPDQEAA